jgi:vanillate O-demethylase ferredoxin subunit
LSGLLLQKTVIVGLRDETPRIRSFTVRHASKPSLPAFTPGAHVAVETPNGLLRHYSLCSDPADPTSWRMAVLREDAGSGGSRSMHELLNVGDVLYVTRPRNYFPLEDLVGRLLLLAAGVGVTPILAMLHELERRGADYEFHYCARSRAEAAFINEIEGLCGVGRLHLHFDGGDPSAGLQLADLLSSQGSFAGLYACGPKPFLDAIVDGSTNWPADRVRFERFSALPKELVGKGEPFEIRVRSTDQVLQVGSGETALSVLRDAGLVVRSECEAGICGSCRVRFLAGEVIHMDAALKTSERSDTMIACVSRARGQVLLDI